MRITNQIVIDRSIASIERGRGEMARLQRQISTGQRAERLSDDAVAGRKILEIDGDLRGIDQFARAISSARSRLVQEDATLQSVSNILARARELAIAQASDTSNADTRRAAALEVAELTAAVIQAANQRSGEGYLFGGAHADRPPLDTLGALDPAAPARGAPLLEIGSGQFAAAAHDAGEVFIDTDVVGALNALEGALLADDRDAIVAAEDRTRSAHGRLQERVAEVGAREARLDTTATYHERLATTLQTRRSDLADAPIVEAITRLVAVQSAFQASLLATNRILDTTLINYMR